MGRDGATHGEHIGTDNQLSTGGYAPEWLALREPVDAAARAEGLIEPLNTTLLKDPLNQNPVVIRDLGCGTGSMGRWLSKRLRAPQHWVLYDRDPELLARAAMIGVATGVAASDDTSRVTFETRQGDLTGLTTGDLAGTSLVTCSALLDLLTAEEMDALAVACVEAGCPALFTLSVAGKVEFSPAEPLDASFAEAFNEHQRRDDLLGPEAVSVAVEAFERRGATVLTGPSPWRLDADHAMLTAEWLKGWVAAACEQEPGLAEHADAYLGRRLDDSELRVVVHHTDLLAIGPES